jgi:hypothetical protein
MDQKNKWGDPHQFAYNSDKTVIKTNKISMIETFVIESNN